MGILRRENRAQCSAAHARMSAILCVFALTTLVLFSLVSPVNANDGATYSATVIPSVAQSGGSVNVRLQITAFTSDAEKAQLKEEFSKSGSDKGLALLRTMSKGYINIAGQSGRKIMAAFTLPSPNGKRLILITEHVLSVYEQRQGVQAQDYPLTIIHIQLDPIGKAVSGQVYPAAKLTVTEEGFVDVSTQTVNTATLIDIVRVN
jgi:hypothetical protein